MTIVFYVQNLSSTNKEYKQKMTQHEKFSELFSNILSSASIECANGNTGTAYVVYNDNGILFSITFLKSTGAYVFGHTNLLKTEYNKYNLSEADKPDPQKLYETVSFAYKTQQIAKRAQKDFSTLYNDILIDSDVIYQMRGDFETYMVINSGIAGFAIGHNKKTGQYGFKRYELVNTLYTVCGISPDKKPNYAKLYKYVKDMYLAQCVLKNMENFEIEY